MGFRRLIPESVGGIRGVFSLIGFQVHTGFYLWLEGHPIEERLSERLAGPTEAVAPDGG